ncbi:hypothetical protein [Paenibacillus silviterrae]|uniref:hypothetical protein n=1 Tax=Paenibacillus silviterrae TaxID=3242194 RepID=UPI002542951D|nr:hypothetical protein [Paenibacillus chinjuensis]
MTSQIEQPAMVIEPGRGRIEIYTTHVTTSKEELERIDAGIARICWSIIDEMIARGNYSMVKQQ